MLIIPVPAISPGEEVPLPPLATGNVPVTAVERLTGKFAPREVVESVKADTEEAKEAVEVTKADRLMELPCNVTEEGLSCVKAVAPPCKDSLNVLESSRTTAVGEDIGGPTYPVVAPVVTAILAAPDPQGVPMTCPDEFVVQHCPAVM